MAAIAKNSLLLALIYCLLAPALFGVEKQLLGAEAYLQVLPICCLSVFFFVSTVGVLMLLRRALQRNKHFENLFSLATMLLSFACIVVFILYAVTEVAVWSASGLASLLVVIAIYAIAITKSHALKHSMMMAAGIGALGTISIVVLRLQELFSFLIVDVLHRDLTLTTRTIVWDKAFDVIESAPIFGYGLEESVTAQIRFGTVESSHNYFLDQIYYGGVVALCLLMLGLYMLGSRLRKCPSKEVVAVLASCLGGFFCLGIVEPLGMGFAYLIIPVVVSYHACSFESAAHPSKEMSNERS